MDEFFGFLSTTAITQFDYRSIMLKGDISGVTPRRTLPAELESIYQRRELSKGNVAAANALATRYRGWQAGTLWSMPSGYNSLSDRVLVMTPRPGRVIANTPVTLSRPRSQKLIYSPAFVAQARHIREAIGGGADG